MFFSRRNCFQTINENIRGFIARFLVHATISRSCHIDIRSWMSNLGHDNWFEDIRKRRWRWNVLKLPVKLKVDYKVEVKRRDIQENYWEKNLKKEKNLSRAVRWGMYHRIYIIIVLLVWTNHIVMQSVLKTSLSVLNLSNTRKKLLRNETRPF